LLFKEKGGQGFRTVLERRSKSIKAPEGSYVTLIVTGEVVRGRGKEVNVAVPRKG